MTETKLTIKQKIQAPLPYVYYNFSNKSGWMEWFTYRAYGYAQKDAVMRPYNEGFGNFAFYFKEDEPENKIVFDFIDLENRQTSLVEVSFEEEDGAVAVSLVHSGIPEQQFAETRDMWQKGIDNLKTVIEQGKDPRMWDRPYLGITVEGWVTPEIAKQKNLSVDYGMHLDSVYSGSGADKAGLQKGDIIFNINGKEMHTYPDYRFLWESLNPGDLISLSYFRAGVKYDVQVELTGYPLPAPPANAHDFAEQVENFHQRALKRIRQLIEDHNEAQIDYRSAPNEWSVLENLAHLIAYESDLHIWISTMVSGCEENPCSSSHSIRIKSYLSLYPDADSLLAELSRRQKETVALLLEIPAEYVQRKGSFFRLTTDLNFVLRKHYKDHLLQIHQCLENAENVRLS